jgi:hypothetical protein
MKRIGAVALALLYALPSTWALQGSLDLLRAPRPGATCADHGCGCEESARVRGACCCAPTDVPASALQASRCGGTEAARATLLTPPALAATPTLVLPPPRAARVRMPERRLPSSETVVVVDKVPIL